MVKTLSVVVPTVGRADLAKALRSVQEQSVPADEVLVVDDRADPADDLPGVPGLSVTTLRSGGGGAAAARNAGMAAAQGDLIAFLDDDDAWLPHHLASAQGLLAARPDVDVYASAGRVRYQDGRCEVEPSVRYTGRRSLLAFFYGRTSWAGRRRRVMTPTLVFRREVAQIRMDQGLPALEDMWWLLQAEQAGHRLAQSASVDVEVAADERREGARFDLESHLAWAERLDTLRPGTGRQYLVGTVGRQLARSGQREELDRVATHLAGSGPLPVDLRAVLALEHALARR